MAVYKIVTDSNGMLHMYDEALLGPSSGDTLCSVAFNHFSNYSNLLLTFHAKCTTCATNAGTQGSKMYKKTGEALIGETEPPVEG